MAPLQQMQSRGGSCGPPPLAWPRLQTRPLAAAASGRRLHPPTPAVHGSACACTLTCACPRPPYLACRGRRGVGGGAGGDGSVLQGRRRAGPRRARTPDGGWKEGMGWGNKHGRAPAGPASPPAPQPAGGTPAGLGRAGPMHGRRPPAGMAGRQPARRCPPRHPPHRPPTHRLSSAFPCSPPGAPHPQIVCDGMYSSFRRKLAVPDVHHPSFFIGLLLKVGGAGVVCVCGCVCVLACVCACGDGGEGAGRGTLRFGSGPASALHLPCPQCCPPPPPTSPFATPALRRASACLPPFSYPPAELQPASPPCPPLAGLPAAIQQLRPRHPGQALPRPLLPHLRHRGGQPTAAASAGGPGFSATRCCCCGGGRLKRVCAGRPVQLLPPCAGPTPVLTARLLAFLPPRGCHLPGRCGAWWTTPARSCPACPAGSWSGTFWIPWHHRYRSLP